MKVLTCIKLLETLYVSAFNFAVERLCLKSAPIAQAEYKLKIELILVESPAKVSRLSSHKLRTAFIFETSK
jgi:hypothetical protein